jgi:OFA family oxalate/formate antiporter-like MFS transporter
MLLGLIYAYSVVLAPLKTEFDWSVSQMTVVFATSIIFYIVGSLASAWLLEKAGLAKTVLVGAALLVVGFVVCAIVSGAHAYGLVVVAYGVVASTGIGAVYNVLLPVVSKWYPDRPGLSQGTCLMGFGLGGFVLGPLVTYLYGIFPWRGVLLGTGAVLGIVVVLAALLIHNPTLEQAAKLPAANAGEVVSTRECSLPQVLRDPVYYLMVAWLFLIGSTGLAVTGIGRELPLSLGADAMTAAFVIGFVNIGSGCGRFFGGMLADKIGRRRTMYLASAICIVAIATVCASLATGSLFLQTVGFLLLGVGWGTDVMMMVYVTRTVWGQRYMAANLAAMNANSVAAALVGSIGSGVLMEATGNLETPLFVLLGFTIASLFVSHLVNRAMRKERIEAPVAERQPA